MNKRANNQPLTVAVVCARGGSKGLPGKNIRLFAGKPLIAHTIAQALACPGIDAVWVSTDDAAIAEVARACGAVVPYWRPAELATDAAPKIPAIEHLVAHMEVELGRQGNSIATVIDLQPTSPLRSVADIQAAMALCDGRALVVSVTEVSHNPYYAMVEVQADGLLAQSKTLPQSLARRQDAPQVWGLNGALYVWPRKLLAQAATQGFWTVPIRASVMPRERSVDIDDVLDFEWAEFLAAKQGLQCAQ